MIHWIPRFERVLGGPKAFFNNHQLFYLTLL